MSNSVLYCLELSARGCRVETTVNGLRLVNTDAKAGAGFTTPFNVHLAGEANELCITALPTVLSEGRLSTVDDAVVTGAVKIYSGDEVTGPEAGELVADFDLDDAIAERQRELSEKLDVRDAGEEGVEGLLTVTFPLLLEIRFDSQVDVLARRLATTQRIEDETRLRRYAEHLRTLIERRDADQLYQEFRFKFDDYNAAYPDHAENYGDVFPAFLRDTFFPGGPLIEFESDDVGLRSWCDGRIWELYVEPGRPFFMTAGLSEQVNQMDVFVADVDGRLCVVR